MAKRITFTSFVNDLNRVGKALDKINKENARQEAAKDKLRIANEKFAAAQDRMKKLTEDAARERAEKEKKIEEKTAKCNLVVDEINEYVNEIKESHDFNHVLLLEKKVSEKLAVLSNIELEIIRLGGVFRMEPSKAELQAAIKSAISKEALQFIEEYPLMLIELLRGMDSTEERRSTVNTFFEDLEVRTSALNLLGRSFLYNNVSDKVRNDVDDLEESLCAPLY